MALRVIAATDYGASAAFHPACESLDFGRPLHASECLCICLIQLLAPGRTYPSDTVQVSAQLLEVALQEMDWVAAAADATHSGLEQTLRNRLERHPDPESHAREGRLARVTAHSESAACTAVPCVRRIAVGTLAVGDECLDVLDLV